MSATEFGRLRRQVYELRLPDLAQFPCWEFALDEVELPGQDEATVRPYLQTPADPGERLMIVCARFTLADGTQCSGYFYPPPPTAVWDVRLLQPVVIVDAGQIRFYFGIVRPAGEELRRLLGFLGKTPQQVFPLVYESDVALARGPVNGTIPGFSYLKDGRVEIVPI